jgi:hypothetical protein
MHTLMRNRPLLLALFFAGFILPLLDGCGTVRWQSGVGLTTKDGDYIHFGDFDETGAENHLGVEAVSTGDRAQAYKIWKPLAEQGDAGAQNNLGLLYWLRALEGSEADYTEALKWFSKAAGQHQASAYFSIGMMHLGGMGVPSDEFEAFKWIRGSADLGYDYAQYFLGLAYANGHGEVIPQNDAEAIKWMQKAAAQGNFDAQRYLRNNE